MAGPTTLPSQDQSPASAARSAGVNSGSYSAPEDSYASFAARPSAAARSDAWPESHMPAYQSRPSAPKGASPAMTTAPRTRSGSFAAQASAWEAPPGWPMTATGRCPARPRRRRRQWLPTPCCGPDAGMIRRSRGGRTPPSGCRAGLRSRTAARGVRRCSGCRGARRRRAGHPGHRSHPRPCRTRAGCGHRRGQDRSRSSRDSSLDIRVRAPRTRTARPPA